MGPQGSNTDPIFETSIEGGDHPIRLRCNGRLERATVRSLLRVVEDLVSSRPRTIVVDIAGLVVLDEPGHRCLASIEAAARRRGVAVIWSGVERRCLPHLLRSRGVTLLMPTVTTNDDGSGGGGAGIAGRTGQELSFAVEELRASAGRSHSARS